MKFLNKAILSIILTAIATPCLSQNRISADSLRPVIFDGFFLVEVSYSKEDTLDRKGIGKTTKIYFSKEINDTLFDPIKCNHRVILNRANISGGYSPQILLNSESKAYFDYLDKNNLFTSAGKYNPFSTTKGDSILLNNYNQVKKIINVFKGKLTVLGPFSYYTKNEDEVSQVVYTYLPKEDNFTTLIYTVCIWN